MTSVSRRPSISKPKPLGMCLLCGQAAYGPSAVRLRHGCVRQRKWGTEFIELPFEDHSMVKWVCYHCAAERFVSSPISLDESLQGISSDGQCCLCRQVIEPYPLEQWSSMILLELGSVTPSSRGPFTIFKPTISGHLHYFCMDDLHVELWRLIDREDVPDYREYLHDTG